MEDLAQSSRERFLREDQLRRGMQRPGWASSREELLLRNELAKQGPTSRGDVQSYPSIVGVGARMYNAPQNMSGASLGAPPEPVPQEAAQFMEVGPPQPGQNERADLMWEEFKAMNPNLDYEAVARQSGGNVPGGSFSQMPESEAQKRQEQELYDFVNNQVPYDEAMRKLDPRSRGYDPKGAEVLLNMLESQRNAKIAEQEVAGRTQGTAADMIRARAAMMEAEAAKSLADRGLTSGGYPFGGGGGKNNELDQIADLADRVYSTNPKMTEDDMNAINAFILKGDRENAIRVLAKYVPQLGMNPDNAMPPAGAQAVARQEGRPAITPQGGEYVFTYGP